MKKIYIVLGVIAVFLIIAVPVTANYIHNRYVGVKYYFKAPAAPELKQIYSDSGQEVVDSSGNKIKGWDYENVQAFDKNGKSKTVSFVIDQSSDMPDPLTQGAAYQVEASKTIVTKGPASIEQSAIPQGALDKLK